MKHLLVWLMLFVAGCGNAQNNEQITLQQFVDAMNSAGLETGQKSEKMFGMIMAIDGFGIDVNGDQIQVYQYDTSIKSGQDLVGKFAEEGIMGRRAVVSKNLLMMEDAKHPDWERILAVFNSM